MSHAPWNKGFKELNRYDWLTAVGLAPEHLDKPRDLRLANVIMQHTSNKHGMAFPTQETLARWAGVSDARQIRVSVRGLQTSGAIKVKTIGNLTEEELDALGPDFKRHKRGKVYKIDLFWAWEVFEQYRYRLKNPQSEPEKLKKGRIKKRTQSVLQMRTVSVRQVKDGDSPANTVRETVLTLGRGCEREKNSNSKRDVAAATGQRKTKAQGQGAACTDEPETWKQVGNVLAHLASGPVTDEDG